MIKYNNKTINDWYFDNKNIIKVYKNNAVCYYKIVSGGVTPSQEPCFAVVNDITQYSDTEFVDAYDKATDKWYKLNNLNQYEQYGIYGEGRNITYYKGKLTIDEGYEYEWDGSEWSSLGEVEGSTKESDFTTSDIDENVITSDFSVIEDGTHGVILPVSLSAQTTSAVALMGSSDNNRLANLSSHTKTSSIGETDIIDYAVWKFNATSSANTYYIQNVGTGKYWGYQDVSVGNALPLVDEASKVPVVLSAFTKNNVTAIGICKGNDPNKDYAVNDLYAYHYRYNWFNKLSAAGDLNNSYVIYKMVGSSAVYPKYYAEKDEPENNVVFEDMEEALAYECPWVGMRATIDGELYTFDSNNEWSKVLYYYRVEDVTTSAQGGSGWTVTGSSTYNPDLDYYDDYSVYQESTTSQYKVAKVTIFGYNNFTYYLRSSGYSNNNYVVATNLDEVQTDPTTMVYYDSRAITNTYNFNKAPASVVNLSNYRRVTYNNLDKTVEHTFYVIFYGRTYSSYQGTATLLIPKDQSEENWEQVTFSVSTNVGSAQKNLYIDGNSSTSGGTDNFYYRWIVGLPSRSHSSYTNYSNYNYCPSVTSSTFTSVAGDVRQVDYAYTNTTMKNLQFRLVDGGGNIITTGDTVYYNMSIYNGCGASTYASNIPFPTTRTVTVGGSFYFTNSSDRHYIYGYAPNIQFNTSYYSDNYNTYFDIPYAKLDTEAVTVTYTTYDPNDTETPSFSTNITYPYNGGTTSSITLTSYDVPYTYPYVVSQTNIMFSADSQLFTAGQTSRTVTFTLYPNNRDFSTVADMEAYQYAWEGMVAYVDDTRYKYENGEWVEKAGLPDVPFTVNINAKNYNATTKTFAKTDGQLANTDIVITAGTPVLNDGYVTVSTNTRGVITGYQTYFNRDNNNPNLTIISKQRTDNAYNGHMFANRDSDYNWMYRAYGNKLTLHGTNETGSLAVTSQPVIESVRVSSERTITYNNYTDNTTSSTSNFSYGSTNSGGVALFAGYVANDTEWFSGDFYWIYISQTTLTDEQIQQVIDYNENL